MTTDTLFPPGFVWGVATSAYQVEGAVREGGRGPSIWDTFSRVPGQVAGGDTGDVAADHYHRYREDTALMAGLGLGAYRFSIAWPRVQPEGRGPANPHGLDFYSRLVDSLLESGIQPWVTLYHWDLPQALQDAGGWAGREVVGRFVEYAAIVYEALRDRVDNWTTLNEPWCAAFLGHAAGIHAPGVQDPATAVQATHHLLLAHGQTVRALRALATGPRIGINLNLDPVLPATPAPADVDAARRIDGLYNRLFLDPLFLGRYPGDVLDDLDGLGGLDRVDPEELATIAAPLDLLGVNYYRPFTVAARPGRPRFGGEPSAWVGAGDVEFVPRGLPQTALGWEIDASGLDELLLRLHRDYPRVPLFVTENGAAFDDGLDPEGRVRDDARVRFLDEHLRAAHRAIRGGVDLRGFFVWSLLDNFEWAEGYAKRFGIVYVDFATQRRVPKDSARWYRDAIARGGLDGRPPDSPGHPPGVPPDPSGPMTFPGAPGTPPTLEQVAALAGVSRATVSRVVNGSPRVSAEVRAQVERAVAKLGYVPNRAARSLVTRRADSIALVVSEPESRFFSEPFFAGVVRGVSAALAETDIQLVLLMTQDLPHRGRLERYVTGGHVDGVLLASIHGDDPLPRTLERAGVPAVMFGRPASGSGIGYVDADNRGGAREAVAHLVQRGLRRIATIAGPQDMSAGVDRLDGYQDGLRAAGLPQRAGLVEGGDFGEESGAAAMRRLLRREPGLDAVFAASDLMAAGALHALRAAGRRVPDDVAVVGFEDAASARLLEPPLTTVRQPVEEMGRQATRLLLAKVAGEAAGMSVILKTELVVRASA